MQPICTYREKSTLQLQKYKVFLNNITKSSINFEKKENNSNNNYS